MLSAQIGRSLQDLVAFLNELHGKHSHLCLHKQGIDTSTPGGKRLFRILVVFSEFEPSMIVERVKAGLKRTKAEGKVLGRPPEGGARHASDDARIGRGKLYGSANRGCMRGLKSFGYAWLDREGVRGGSRFRRGRT